MPHSAHAAAPPGDASPPLFPLGQVLATPGALSLLQSQGFDGRAFLDRHRRGDWGVLCAADCAENAVALREGYRLMSVYPVGSKRLWIITEADRSVTTLLLPAEY